MFRHILFPTDGSTISRRVAKIAVEFAKSNGAQLTVLHVIPPWAPPNYVEGIIPYPELVSPEEYERATKKAAESLLEKVAILAESSDVPCKTVVVSDSPTWKAIVATAKSKRCDVIVMASHGRRGLEGVLLGSETHRVLTHSKIPVLVCR